MSSFFTFVNEPNHSRHFHVRKRIQPFSSFSDGNMYNLFRGKRNETTGKQTDRDGWVWYVMDRFWISLTLRDEIINDARVGKKGVPYR